MASRKRPSEAKTTHRRPATTPEARENQMVSRAFDLAEEQLLNGTASSQVVTHFLKLGSSREKLEQEKIELENELTRVKKENLESQARIEELYGKAIEAMQTYSGGAPVSHDEEPDDED